MAASLVGGTITCQLRSTQLEGVEDLLPAEVDASENIGGEQAALAFAMAKNDSGVNKSWGGGTSTIQIKVGKPALRHRPMAVL